MVDMGDNGGGDEYSDGSFDGDSDVNNYIQMNI